MVDNDAPHGLTAQMYGKKLWVCLSRAVKPREEVMQHLKEHLAHQVNLEKTGVMFAAGPMDPKGENEHPRLGLIIIRAESEEAARRIFDADPMHASGVRTYSLFEWTANEGNIAISINLSDKTYTLA
ncbi:MAG: hypothetical protein KDJ29_04520 [Hyphomicrobiales bacterium]|nr:hypothetical protein [Hyphomicrobiales bacterium]